MSRFTLSVDLAWKSVSSRKGGLSASGIATTPFRFTSSIRVCCAVDEQGVAAVAESATCVLPVPACASSRPGHHLRAVRGDCTFPKAYPWLGSVDISIKKAFTSRAFDIATQELAKSARPGGPFYGIHASNEGKVVIFAGGVPLRKNGKVVGAVGVSGGTGDQYHGVATAGASAFCAPRRGPADVAECEVCRGRAVALSLERHGDRPVMRWRSGRCKPISGSSGGWRRAHTAQALPSTHRDEQWRPDPGAGFLALRVCRVFTASVRSLRCHLRRSGCPGADCPSARSAGRMAAASPSRCAARSVEAGPRCPCPRHLAGNAAPRVGHPQRDRLCEWATCNRTGGCG